MSGLDTPEYRSLFSCDGKVVVVTGGSGALGAQFSAGLAAHGARVFVADVEPPEAADVDHVRMDITDGASIGAALDDVVERAGGLHGLVNCAYPRTEDWGARLEDVPMKSWRTNVDWHLGGYFECCREAASRMSPEGGSIVNLSSIYGIVGPTWSIYEGTEMTMPVAYSAIKAGILGLTRYLATAYGPSGIRVNAVSPGGIQAGQPASFVQRYSADTPLGRMARADEVVGAIVYLVSDASSYVTGHNLVVDGGWTAR
jgi:NAD(P)-dependent dehydrogenase (short-subunit alcohol dehydrogenase family)